MKGLFVGVFLCFFISLQAQDKGYWLVQTGLNVSEIQEQRELAFDLGSTTGWHLSLARNFQLNEFSSIQAGIGYSQKGGKDRIESLSTSDLEEKFDLRVDYLTLPLIFKTSRGNFFSELGFEPAINLGPQADVSDPSIDAKVLESTWDSDFDLSFLAGVGYKINRLEVGLRALPGLVKVSDKIRFTDSNGETISEKRYGRNLVIQINLGYRL